MKKIQTLINNHKRSVKFSIIAICFAFAFSFLNAATLTVNTEMTSVMGGTYRYANARLQEIQGDSSKLVAMAYEFLILDSDGNPFTQSLIGTESDGSLYIVGDPLPYPNPMQINPSDDDLSPVIAYRLSTGADIDFRLYDIRGNELYREIFAKDSLGGLSGWQEVPLEFDAWGLGDLPSSAYFFILIGDGQVIGRGKFVIRP